MPRDRFGREIDYLRLSVIDHCNLRCVYCMPLRGLSFVPAPELLTAAEIETVARAAVGVGLPQVPPDRRRADAAARHRRDHGAGSRPCPGVQDLAMTTNGILLPAAGEAAARGRPHAPQHPRGHPRTPSGSRC